MKISRICSILAACCTLSGCSIFNSQSNEVSNNKNDSKVSVINSDDDSFEFEEEPLELEPNTPQSWIDLFTFTNVTILYRYNLKVLTDHDYKCVDGKWYCKDEGYEEFVRVSGRNIFDIFLCHYSAFTFESDLNRYTAENWIGDESQYMRNSVIELDENNRVSFIWDEAFSNSSSLISEITFCDYGTTTL